MSTVAELQSELFGGRTPSYANEESQKVLAPTITEGARALKAAYEKYAGEPPSYKRLKVRVEALPTYVQRFKDAAGRIYERIVGQVFGEYVPGLFKGTLKVDPSVVYGNHPKRKLLESSGIKVEDKTSVVTHELAHAAHDGKGVLRSLWNYFGDKMRPLAEGLATYVTELATGKSQNVYPREQQIAREYVGRFGRKAAFVAA